MRKKRLAVMATRSLISMCIFSLIFIFVTEFNTEKAISIFMEEIYNNADSEAQASAIELIEGKCDNILSDNALLLDGKICSEEIQNQIKESCDTYYEGLASGQIERSIEKEKSCELLNSEEFKKGCEDLIVEINLTMMGEICELHNNNLISDLEFFRDFLAKTVIIPEGNLVESFSSTMFVVILIAVLLSLIIILFVLHKENYKELLYSLGRIIFHIGMFFTLTYLALFVYRIVLNPNTSFILNSVADQGANISETLIVMIPLIFARIFNEPYLIIGIILLTGGITLKIVFRKR